jgi:hypothetical protein
MENNQGVNFTEEQIKNLELAYQLAKEVVEAFNFEDVSNYVDRDIDINKANYYKIDDGRNIKAYAEVGTMYGDIKVQFSLTLIALDLIRLCQFLLSDEKAPTVLKSSVFYELQKRNIDMLTLFDLKESEVEETIKETTKRVLGMFIQNIPLFTRSGIIDALGHSKIGYCQYLLKPLLKEHWQKLGLPDDFNLITEPELESVKKYNTDRKKWFLVDRKQLLNMDTLADEADNLRKQYRDAKAVFLEYKGSFDLLNPNASDEEWEDKWIDIRLEKFPTLHYKALDSINQGYRPFELVLIHLAEIYGYDEESMRKKITTARKLKRKKNQ